MRRGRDPPGKNRLCTWHGTPGDGIDASSVCHTMPCLRPSRTACLLHSDPMLPSVRRRKQVRAKASRAPRQLTPTFALCAAPSALVAVVCGTRYVFSSPSQPRLYRFRVGVEVRSST